MADARNNTDSERFAELEKRIHEVSAYDDTIFGSMGRAEAWLAAVGCIAMPVLIVWICR